MEIHCGMRPLEGGFWERLIQSVKKCLKKTLGRTSLNYDELNTISLKQRALLTLGYNLYLQCMVMMSLFHTR